MPLLRPASLFGQTSLILSGAFLLFLVLVIGTVVRFILLPVAERSTADLAALMVLSVQTWAELPPETRPDFERELVRGHQIKLAPIGDGGALSPRSTPYLALLSRALETRLGRAVDYGGDPATPGWYWFEIPMAGRLFRVGFSAQRIHSSVPLAALIVLGLGALLTLLTSTLLVRRLNRPLARLVENVQRMGRGEYPQPLPETGPVELASLARGFNRMVQDLKRLSASRTLMLAGISHDIRTPLTHMALVVEMLPAEVDPALRRQMEKDLADMDALIDQAMAFSNGLVARHPEPLELSRVLAELAGNYQGPGRVVETAPLAECRVRASPPALRRVLGNLLDNALRYGGGRPVTLELECDRQRARIVIADRGPGIPREQRESVFEPFYRLETSRNRRTGGSGLGLAIVRQLADLSGWRVVLEENPGGGTRAVVEIPRDGAAG
ncbi:MAG TPA: HAMP domain-containing protein [Sedimenticola sp.]|nr:HAMP domain-containing protein [Sedimenticola sp.]